MARPAVELFSLASTFRMNAAATSSSDRATVDHRLCVALMMDPKD
jgi:phosphotransferase system HPr-like phosphotransfer protein